MKVHELIEILKQKPQDADVRVACQGYDNYDPCTASGYWDHDDTYVVEAGGELFISDSCHIEWEED